MSEPVEPAPHKGYLERLDKGVLAYQRCDDCRAAVFHPRVTCTGCGSGRLAWKESAGLGTVYSASALGRRDAEPYSVALVDLDEGFRMMSTVMGIPAGDVRIGMRVRAPRRAARRRPGPAPGVRPRGGA